MGMDGVPELDEFCGLEGVSKLGGVLAEPGCVPEQAAVLGGLREGRHFTGAGKALRRCPEAGRGNVLAAGMAAVLLEVVSQPVSGLWRPEAT